jgi:hypothetical protein
MLDKWNRYALYNTDTIYDVMQSQIIPDKALEFLDYQALMRSISLLQRAIAENYEYQQLKQNISLSNFEAWQAGTISTEYAVAREVETRNSIYQMESDIRDLQSELAAVSQQYAAYPFYDRTTARTEQYFGDTRKVLDSFYNDIIKEQTAAAIRQYTMATGSYSEKISNYENIFSTAQTFYNGVEEPNAVTGTTALSKYPDKTLSALMQIEGAIKQDLQLGKSLVADFENEPADIFGGTEIEKLYDETVTHIERLDELSKLTGDLKSRAEFQVEEAALYFSEATDSYYRAISNVRSEDFTGARNNLAQALESYDTSFAMQESQSARIDWNNNYTTLLSEIDRLELELVTRSVRTSIDDARVRYYSGELEQAEALLVQAQRLWRNINIDPHTEVVFWLRIVRGALSLRSGRSIPVTAPLYPEMSQLLSTAYRHYNEGVARLEARQRPLALQNFAIARENTQKVRLMFPINQDASLLELRIDRITDPTNFNATFQRRLDDAVVGSRQGSREAFADLQDLVEINPNYPGIHRALLQAEIDMGLRPPPPDPQVLLQAQELALAAERLFSARDRTQYPIVLEQVNRALAIDPNNTLAMEVKDRVQVEMGLSGGVIMSSETEQLYQDAVRELQRGNPILAMSIVQRMMADPANRNSFRVQELRRRIESML